MNANTSLRFRQLSAASERTALLADVVGIILILVAVLGGLFVSAQWFVLFTPAVALSVLFRVLMLALGRIASAGDAIVSDIEVSR